MAPPKPKTRILIGAGCFADAEAAMRLVDRILTSLPAELGGVLVDEDVMGGGARWPGQRVVTMRGALVAPPSLPQIRTLQASDARAFRNRLAALARTQSLKWSFERRGGDLIHGMFEAAQGWDILLLGHRELHKRPGHVVILTSDPTASDRAAALARNLAGVLTTSVLTLCLSDKDAGSDATGSVRITVRSPADLLAHLGRINAAAVVIDLATSPPQMQDQLRQLLDAARCPVAVLGMDQARLRIAHTTVIPPAPEDQTAERHEE